MAFKPAAPIPAQRPLVGGYPPAPNSFHDSSGANKRTHSSNIISYEKPVFIHDNRDACFSDDPRPTQSRISATAKYLLISVFLVPFWIITACDTLSAKQCSVLLNGPTAASSAACISLGITTVFSTRNSLFKFELETAHEKFHAGWVFINVSLLPKCSGQILHPLLGSLMIILSLTWGTMLATAALFGRGSYCKAVATFIVILDLFAFVIAFANIHRNESAEQWLLFALSVLLAVGISVQ
jgi:hypothetical protein